MIFKYFVLILLFSSSLTGLISSSFAQSEDLERLSSRNQEINKTLDLFEGVNTESELTTEPAQTNEDLIQVKSSKTSEPSKVQTKEPILNKVKIKGQIHSVIGMDSNGEAFLNRANGNLTEKDFRVLDNNALDRKLNTYDPAVYSRFKVVTDATVARFTDMHLNITMDPWSVVGKTKKITVNGSSGDKAEFQYFVWGNSGYSINQNLNTLLSGDLLALREIKVDDGRIAASSFLTKYGNTFNVPELKVEYSVQPIREAWLDIKPETNTSIRIFPMAYQDQALTSDDPLKLSNNTHYWAESPWLWGWQKGNVNSGATPSPTFTQGQWDRSLPFATRDSDLQRLTALRGVTLKVFPDDDNSIDATIATPKTLWQEYSEVTALPASLRMKHYFEDTAYIGTINNMHLGYNEGSLDASNYVGGIDGGFVPVSWLMAKAQVSSSKSRYDITSKEYGYNSKKEGNAYYASVTSTSNSEQMIRKDYFGLSPVQKTDNFYKARLYFSRMDRDFESTLSNYHDTRQDSFWSRHLTFYPNTYRNMPGVAPSSSEYDLESFAYGSGIDYGRKVIGLRGDTQFNQGKIKGLFDFRRVMTNRDQHIETVSRTQWSYQATDKWITKALLMWHALPSTVKDEDPFVYDHLTGDPLKNFKIAGGDNRDLKTVSLGNRYELSSWANINGVWEYTNDFTLGTNNFPNGLFTNVAYITNDGFYRRTVSQVYGPFQKAPYVYHNIFKTGLELIPMDAWHIYLDYTRNPNNFASNIDDNMNHFGIETSITPNKKLGFFARYTYSRGYDLTRVYENQELVLRGYHNVYLESRLLLPDTSLLSLQYGVGPTYDVKTSSVNPDLSYYSSPTLETQHLIRLVYDKKF